jgi:hypothetical protein
MISSPASSSTSRPALPAPQADLVRRYQRLLRAASASRGTTVRQGAKVTTAQRRDGAGAPT